MRTEVADGTLRREAGPWTPAVHALLRHFEAVGFDGVPRALGIEGGQEILSFVEGERSYDPSDEVVAEVGALVRRMHDAQDGFARPADARWQRLPNPVRGNDVICHNDLLGSNVLFRSGRPAAIIDWELAAPGPRGVDLAAPASHWVPLRPDEDVARHGFPIDRRRERLRLLLDGYDYGKRATFLDLVADVWRSWSDAYRIWGGEERRECWAPTYDAGRCERIQLNIEWLQANRSWLI